MTARIKLCGMSRPEDIEAVNGLRPDFIGFVFWKPSRRYVEPERAAMLKGLLLPDIKAVGVFVDEEPEAIASLVRDGVIDLIQLHGSEDKRYIDRLRAVTDVPVIQAIRVSAEVDIEAACDSTAEYVLLDSGKGGGRLLDWELAAGMRRPYFLAGGLAPENVGEAIDRLSPWAVDVSSGIETDGHKDSGRMAAFVAAVRGRDQSR